MPGRPKYRDFGIRPRGSPEISYDPLILMQLSKRMLIEGNGNVSRRRRVLEVFNFIVKIALNNLPPKQRKIFYSVWVRSGGRMNKGVMEYSRRIKQSHYTNYNNYYKALYSLQSYLEKTGYDKIIIEYLSGNSEHLEDLDRGLDSDII